MLFNNASAQLTTQIGTGTNAPLTNNSIYSPICRFNASSGNDCSRSNLLYTAAELTSAGITTGATINKIAFYKIGTGASTGGFTFEIHMRNSSTAAPLVNTTWATILTTHTPVYNNTAQTIPNTSGWIEFTLTTPFVYTGQSLEIAMSHDMTAISGNPSDGPFDWQYTTGFQDYIIGTVSTTLAGVANLSGTVANYKVRPNIQFNYSTGTAPGATLTGVSSICNGGTTTLTGSPSGGTYSSGTTSVATVNSSTGVVTAVSPGTSVITYTQGSNTATLTVTVNAGPATPNPITGTTNVCAGATTNLSSTTAGGTWSSSNTAVATVSTNGTVTGVSAGTATITYTVTNAAGCTASVNTNVTVAAAPSVSPTTGTASVCVGGTNSLVNTTAGGTWTSSNTAVATVSSLGVVTGVSAGTATITYTITNSAGCSASVTTIVTVTAAPILSPINGNTTICQGATSNLTNPTAGGNWTSSNTTVVTVGATGTVTGVSTGTSTITYTVTNAAGCSSSVTTVVTVNPSPTVSAITGTSSICVGATSTLSNTTAGGTWTSNNNPVATVNTAGLVTGVTSGTATITYTVTSQGCSSLATLPITVNALPTPSIIQNGAILTTGIFTTYSWNLNNNPIPGANAQTHIATENGNYTVTVTDANGCTGTSAVTSVTGLSVNNANLSKSISLYPNPTQDIVQIKAEQQVNITISGLDGREMIKQENVKSVNISNLANGIYLFKIFDKNGQFLQSEKLIKSSK